MMARLKVTYAKSSIGYRSDQVHTIRSLGLRKLGQSVIIEDTPDLRGMVGKVAHLVTVAEIESAAEES